jgi:hypothetical protein
MAWLIEADTVKRNMVKAVKDSWDLAFSEHERQWGINIGTDVKDMSSTEGIVNLGNGLCFPPGGSVRGSQRRRNPRPFFRS